jgi:ankyrin repeat protein
MTADEEFSEACFRADIERALALIASVDPGWRSPASGWSLLHVAVEHGHAEVVRGLVAAGVDIEATDHSGWTPLCLAVDADIDGAAQAEVPCALTMTRLLLELGANPNGGRGTSPIEIAMDYGHGEAVRLLSRRPGAD